MKIISVFTLLLLLLSCSSKEQETDEFHLDEHKMVSVLIDFQLAETIITTYPGANDTLTNQALASYEMVFEKHKITKAQFEESMDYYSKNPAELNLIFSRVVDSLSLRLATLGTQEQITQ